MKRALAVVLAAAWAGAVHGQHAPARPLPEEIEVLDAALFDAFRRLRRGPLHG
jgi:hypothetical protein